MIATQKIEDAYTLLCESIASRYECYLEQGIEKLTIYSQKIINKYLGLIKYIGKPIPVQLKSYENYIKFSEEIDNALKEEKPNDNNLNFIVTETVQEMK